MPNTEKNNTEKISDAKTASEEHLVSDGSKVTDVQAIHKSNTPLMIVLLAIAGLLFVAAVAAVTGNVFIRNHSGFMFGRSDDSTNTLFSQRGNDYRGMRSGGGMMGLRNFNTNSTTNLDAVSGVVTSVGASSFVIAGGGKQYTINTTGSTTYNTTDQKVSVNDSVIVLGTISDKTISASSIRIINF